VGERGGGQAGGDGAVELNSGDAVLGVVECLVDGREHQHVEEGGDALRNDSPPKLQGPETSQS
jgi:hypothetical protein